MLRYALRRLPPVLVTLALLLLCAAWLAAWQGGGCSNSQCTAHPAVSMWDWLDRIAHFDFGFTVDAQPVISAIGAALPASALLLLPIPVINVLLGWGGGLCTAASGLKGRLGRFIRLLLDLCAAVPIFWLGALLIEVFSIQAGWLPAGGISGPRWPAFGTDAYRTALADQPFGVLADLLSHLAQPLLTLVLASAALDMDMAAVAFPAALRAPWSTTARAAGLTEGRVAWRAARAAVPPVIAGSSAGTPLLLSALVLVEYLFGWPGLGMLAYHAARTGDGALLSALLLLFGTAAVIIHYAADLLSAWADPALREPMQ